MKKIIKYFYPKEEQSYFDKLKTNFYIIPVLFLIPIILYFLINTIINPDENFVLILFSEIGFAGYLSVSLVIIKYKGIKLAGNISSLLIVIVLLIPMNILRNEIPAMFKYMYGFYTVFTVFIYGILLADRKILIINFILIVATTTRVYLFAVKQSPVDIEFFKAGYFNHLSQMILVALIALIMQKYTQMAINKANREAEIQKDQNEELITVQQKIEEADGKLRQQNLLLDETIKARTNELIVINKEYQKQNIELKIAKERAEESDKLKTEFLNNMSHEIRTPLNGIIGLTDVFNNPDMSVEERQQFVDLIHESGNKLMEIIDNVLEISKIVTKQIQISSNKIFINYFLENLRNEYLKKADEKNISINLIKSISDEKCIFYTDKSLLYKILSEIVENAVQYTEQGFIEIAYNLKTENDSPKILEISVKDTGIGIKPENFETIFKTFSQEEKGPSRHFGGLGLGLSIAKEGIELLGGNISLNSEKGKGSTFYVTVSCNKNSDSY
jgi:signal transduction histidine kinase